MVNKRNHPQMAARFRLVKYYNLPRTHQRDTINRNLPAVVILFILAKNGRFIAAGCGVLPFYQAG
jgi:hypothetical protein